MNPAMTVHTIDTGYAGQSGFAAAYRITEGDQVTFVETNTSRAVPRLLASLEEVGRSPEDVAFIIVTHVHLDHAGGAGVLAAHCPRAMVLAHPRAVPHLVDPDKLVTSAKGVYGEAAFAELCGEVRPIPAERVRAMGDEEELVFGARRLRFLHTAGHANHHVCIHDSATNGIFTGDSFGIAYPRLQTRGLRIFPTTTPTDFDARAYQATVRRIAELAPSRVYLTHYGELQEVAEAARSLDEQLEAYAALVEDADQPQYDEAAVEQRCREQVEAFFAALFDEEQRAAGAELLKLDLDLNAQGVAFAVKKRRFKRGAS